MKKHLYTTSEHSPLAKARIAAKLTQAQLAEKMGVSSIMVSYWETGHIPILQRYQEKLESILGVIEGVEYKQPQSKAQNLVRTQDNALRRARKKLNLSQIEVARKLGIAPSYYCSMELRDIPVPEIYRDKLNEIFGSVQGIHFTDGRNLIQTRTQGKTPLAYSRVAMGITQKKLAQLLNIHQSTLSTLEHGKDIPQQYIDPILALLGKGALGYKAQNRTVVKKDDLTGRKFGRLTAIEALPIRDGRNVVWRCICDCGNECNVPIRHLTTGAIKSCGCLKAENLETVPREEKLGQVENTNLSRLRSTRIQRNNSTGVKGVSRTKNGKYEVYVYFQKHRHRVGFYDTLEEAAQARMEAWIRICKPTLDKYDKKNQPKEPQDT